MAAVADPETTNSTTLTVAKADLAKALRAAATVKSKELRLDVYLSGRSTVTAAVREVAVTVDLPGEQDGDGRSILIPRTTLARLLPYLGPQVELEIDAATLQVRDGASWFAIPVMAEPSADDDERFYGHDLAAVSSQPVAFDAPVLVEALRRALPFTQTCPTRPLLQMVALYPQEGIAAATDSYRLAVIRYGKSAGEGEQPILLHRDAARSMVSLLKKRLGEVTVTRADTHLIAAIDDIRWSAQLPKPGPGKTDVSYPDWRSLLPDGKPETTVRVDRDELLQAARAAAVVLPRNAPLRMRIADDKVTVASVGWQPGKPRLRDNDATMSRTLTTACATGENMEIGLNPDFVADMAANAREDRLEIGLLGPLRPVKVEAGTDTHLLMPIRLNV